MISDYYQVRIEDLLSIPHSGTRWILIKKALAADARSPTTKPIEFAYRDLEGAERHLIKIADDSSEFLYLPTDLEPEDEADKQTGSPLLLTFAKKAHKGPKVERKRQEVVEEIESEMEVIEQPAASPMPVPDAAEDEGDSATEPAREAAAVDDARDDPQDGPILVEASEAIVDVAEDRAEVSRSRGTASILEALASLDYEPEVVSADEVDAQILQDLQTSTNVDDGRDEMVAEETILLAQDGAAPDDVAETEEEPVVELITDMAVREASEPISDDSRLDEATVAETEVTAQKDDPAAGTFRATLDGILAVEQKRARWILLKKMVAAVVGRRHVRSLGPDQLGTEENAIAILRAAGGWVDIPLGGEPGDHSDHSRIATSIEALFTTGDWRVPTKPLPEPVKRRSRVVPDPAPDEPPQEGAQTTLEEEERPKVEDEPGAETELPTIDPAAAVEAAPAEPMGDVSMSVASALPFHSEIHDAWLRDAAEAGLSASRHAEWLARSLEAEAARLRILGTVYGQRGN